MLKGKPAGENDQVTMDAIRNILSEYEHSFEGAQTANARPRKGGRRSTPAELGNLRPVQEVATKLTGVYLNQPALQAPDSATTSQTQTQAKPMLMVT